MSSVTGTIDTRCRNEQCAQPLESGTRFCPFCARDQRDTGSAAAALGARLEQRERASSGAGASPNSAPSNTPTVPRMPHPTAEGPYALPADSELVMRASDNIWSFEEPEQEVAPGQRRPLVLLDEQTVHLAHTSQHLSGEELLRRVQRLVALQAVPVEVRLLPARWQNDGREWRQRLVASLRQGHAYSDMKMILGVDYLGRWASIHMCLGAEPEPRPPLPQMPPKPPAPVPWGPILLGLVALPLIALYGLGILLLVAAFVWHGKSKESLQASHAAAVRQHAADWERERARQEQERALRKAFRSFKVDDMRLFSSAMQEIFQAVVDDIVKQEGATVERVEGGQGGFLSTSGLAQATPAPRKSDAARAAV